MRSCAATRARRDPEDLIRFVVGPDGVLVPDLKRRLPGRGVWIGANAQDLTAAIAKKAFSRSLKGPVTVPPSLVLDVEALLQRDALQALALANKAGALVMGAAKIEGAARRVVALIHAREAAMDSRSKVLAAIRRACEGRAPPVLAEEFTTEQLSLSLGRELVVHAALIAHAASSYALGRLLALRRFQGRGDDPPALHALNPAPFSGAEAAPAPSAPIEDRNPNE